MHSKGNWILWLEEIAKQKVEMISIIATAHYGAANGSLIYLCKSKDLQILEKLSPQGKIVLNSIETGKKMLGIYNRKKMEIWQWKWLFGRKNL